MRQVLARHQTVLVGHAAIKRNPESFDKMKYFTSLADIDRIYSMHVQDRGGTLGPYESLDEFYRDMSSITNLNSVRNFPVMFINAEDDPMIPLHLLRDRIEAYCRTVNEKALLVMTRHGGHLGFFDCAIGVDGNEMHKHVTPVQTCLFQASKFNWLDRIILQYCDAVVAALDADGSVDFEPDISTFRPSSVRRRRRRSRNRLVSGKTATLAVPPKPNQKLRRRRHHPESLTAKLPSDSPNQNSLLSDREAEDASFAAAAALQTERKNTLTNVLASELPKLHVRNYNDDADSTSRSDSRNSRTSSSSSSAGGDVEDDDDDGASSVAGATNYTGSVSACEEYYLDEEFLRAHSSSIRQYKANDRQRVLEEVAEVAPRDENQSFITPANEQVSSDKHFADNITVQPLSTAIDNVVVLCRNEPEQQQHEKDVEKSGTLMLVDDDTGENLVAVSTVEEESLSNLGRQ